MEVKMYRVRVKPSIAVNEEKIPTWDGFLPKRLLWKRMEAYDIGGIIPNIDEVKKNAYDVDLYNIAVLDGVRIYLTHTKFFDVTVVDTEDDI